MTVEEVWALWRKLAAAFGPIRTLRAAALSKANIDIVGGGGDFFNNFAKALSVGKAVEGVSAKSPIVQELLGKFLGGKSLSADTLSGLLNGGSKGLPPAQNSAE